MSRLIGFLAGLLLVVALALAALRHAPADFLAGDEAGDAPAAAMPDDRVPADPLPVPDSKPATEATLPRPEHAPSAVMETLPPVDDTPPAPAETTADAGEPGAADPEANTDPGRNPDPKAAAGPATETGTDAEATVDSGPGTAARQWHAFWQPFRSEISAEGFRRRLEGVTGLDYRVVSPRPGEYQVAFAYRDEAERLAHLAAIEAATGLVLRSRML